MTQSTLGQIAQQADGSYLLPLVKDVQLARGFPASKEPTPTLALRLTTIDGEILELQVTPKAQADLRSILYTGGAVRLTGLPTRDPPA